MLTRPNETQHSICCSLHSLRKETIFHGGISLNDISSLSHTCNVVNVRVLVFLWQMATRYEKEHMSSVLKRSTQLSCVQSELEICLSIGSLCFWIILYPMRNK